MGRAWGRLPDRSDFLRVAARGIRQGAPGFLLQAALRAPDSTPGHAPRVGFTASRKIGNAVLRNRAKRRLRAVTDAVVGTLKADNVDFVLIARPNATSREFRLMTEELRKSALKALTQLQQPATPKPASTL
jgi:ribonuclease P protein component